MMLLCLNSVMVRVKVSFVVPVSLHSQSLFSRFYPLSANLRHTRWLICSHYIYPIVFQAIKTNQK